MSEIEPTDDSPGRGKNGQFIRTLDTAQRDGLAAELRARSMSYRDIALKLGYAGESGAHKAVQRALAAAPAEGAAELRAIEAERLDALARRLWAVLDTKYPLTAPDRVFVDKDGESVPDPRPIIAAVDRLLRISEQRRRLLGLDAPAPKQAEDQPEPASPLELLVRHLAAIAQHAGTTAIETVDLSGLLALPMAAEKAGETL